MNNFTTYINVTNFKKAAEFLRGLKPVANAPQKFTFENVTFKYTNVPINKALPKESLVCLNDVALCFWGVENSAVLIDKEQNIQFTYNNNPISYNKILRSFFIASDKKELNNKGTIIKVNFKFGAVYNFLFNIDWELCLQEKETPAFLADRIDFLLSHGVPNFFTNKSLYTEETEVSHYKLICSIIKNPTNYLPAVKTRNKILQDFINYLNFQIKKDFAGTLEVYSLYAFFKFWAEFRWLANVSYMQVQKDFVNCLFIEDMSLSKKVCNWVFSPEWVKHDFSLNGVKDRLQYVINYQSVPANFTLSNIDKLFDSLYLPLYCTHPEYCNAKNFEDALLN